MWREDHTAQAADFILSKSSARLLMINHSQIGFQVYTATNVMPKVTLPIVSFFFEHVRLMQTWCAQDIQKVQYFLKPDDCPKLTRENMADYVQYGMVRCPLLFPSRKHCSFEHLRMRAFCR
jgi:hypothetical protein